MRSRQRHIGFMGVVVAVSLMAFVLTRWLDTASNNDPTDTPFAIAAADGKGAVVLDGSSYLGYGRDGQQAWRFTPEPGAFDQNVLCLFECPSALIMPFSYHLSQRDRPEAWASGAQVTE